MAPEAISPIGRLCFTCPVFKRSTRIEAEIGACPIWHRDVKTHSTQNKELYHFLQHKTKTYINFL